MCIRQPLSHQLQQHHSQHKAAPFRLARSRSATAVVVRCQQQQMTNKGFSMLEWTSKLVPQGALVTGAKAGWRLAWETMVRELAPQDSGGGYTRPANAFNERIGSPRFPVESGRYHLYVGNACPWCRHVLLALELSGPDRSITLSEPHSPQRPQPGPCPPPAALRCHRVLLALVFSGLDSHISVGWLADVPEQATRGGWVFQPRPDPVTGARDLWAVYDKLSPGYRGRCTAPLLIDKKAMRPVSNESSDIVRMLGQLQLPGTSGVDLYPPHLQQQIDQLNDQVYRCINNGVYRAGFATSQAAYDAAVGEVHGLMAALDQQLGQSRCLLGDRFTEADLRLFPTIIRFDAAYAGLFRCGRRRVCDYPNLQAWLRDVWQIRMPGGSMQVPDTVDVDGCRRSYYSSLFPLNPSGIIPSGPTAADLQLDLPTGRGSHEPANMFFMTAAAAGAAATAGAQAAA
ncbi:putative glutathione S-transferase [Scenedesmus sp. NREL 46B-D3]|nr:putative glutathione S-transferase [Scenedesmus sp. NREL 46B-D3]